MFAGPNNRDADRDHFDTAQGVDVVYALSKMVERISDNLLERVAAGDTGAVREVIDTYGNLVWSLARRFTATEADAEEAVQDIFFVLWRKADQYDRAAGAEVTFIALIARRQLIDRWRRESKHAKVGSEYEPKGVPSRASARLEEDELSSVAFEEYAKLDHDAQHLLRLSIESGCSHSTISEMTGIPLGTVKTKIRTAMRRIRERVARVERKGDAR